MTENTPTDQLQTSTKTLEIEPNTVKDGNQSEWKTNDETQKDPFFRTSLCSYFRKHGECRHGDNCRYAHHETELRLRPDGTWDPTSARGKKREREEEGHEENDDDEEEEEEDEHAEESQKQGKELKKCILDLPLKWTCADFKRFLEEQGIEFQASKKRRKTSFGFVEFECSEHVLSATEKLDGMQLQSKTIKVQDVLPRTWLKTDNCDKSGQTANKRTDICEVVTPWAKLSYQEQLDKKSADISQLLKKLVRNVRKVVRTDAPLPKWVVDAKFKGGLCCDFEGIVGSPVIDGYRNKCEFTIGYTSEKKPIVGFLLGNFREGCNIVMEPDQCRNVSPIARLYAKGFQDFLQSSDLPVWDKMTNTGFWRLFTVREGRDGSGTNSSTEVMLIVQICSTGVDETVRKNEFSRMASELVSWAAQNSQLPLSALLIQDHVGISNAASPDSPLISLPIPQVGFDGHVENYHIHDHICGLRFRISPTAFFQVNTLAAEKLYTLAGDWAGLDSNTLLFDVCCGTGTIGLTLAHRVGMVIGIEMNESAIADARINAEINGIKNCKFVCGKAEDTLQKLLEEHLLDDNLQEASSKESSAENEVVATGSDETIMQNNKTKFSSVVVLVDPPRVGLHPVVLKLLRTKEQIKRLVYVSCNPESLLANAVELCTPVVQSTEKGGRQGGSWKRTIVGNARQRVKSMPLSNPFSPIKALAVDMFPHTHHCEVVMLMER